METLSISHEIIKLSIPDIGKENLELHLETISSEMIKPSTPTPHHLKSFKLSLLDQFFGLTYVPQVLFYSSDPKNNGANQISSNITRLKESLSKALSIYYPLAGRLTMDESAIDCNDKGVTFVIARAKCSLIAFLEAPNRVDYVGHFFTKNVIDDHDQSNNCTTNSTGSCCSSSSSSNSNAIGTSVTDLVPITIQVNIFDCGGLAIGCQWLHKICDGASWGSFLKTWATLATAEANDNKDDDVITTMATPDFVTAYSLFPPCDWPLPPGRRPRTLRPLDDAQANGPGCIVVKAFVFDPQAICALQAKGRSDSVPNPTRIEAVSGFIWKHAMAAAAAVVGSTSGPSVLTHAVNMRPRTSPPLPPTTFGNMFIDAMAYYEGQDQGIYGTPSVDFSDLVVKIRKGLSPVKDSEFLSKFQGEEGAEVLRSYKQKLADHIKDENLRAYKFTSWGRLDMDPDFGFGMPVWIGFTGGKLPSSFRNLIPLIETIGYGIEAWLIMDEQEMAILQSDREFLQYALPTN